MRQDNPAPCFPSSRSKARWEHRMASRKSNKSSRTSQAMSCRANMTSVQVKEVLRDSLQRDSDSNGGVFSSAQTKPLQRASRLLSGAQSLLSASRDNSIDADQRRISLLLTSGTFGVKGDQEIIKMESMHPSPPYTPPLLHPNTQGEEESVEQQFRQEYASMPKTSSLAPYVSRDDIYAKLKKTVSNKENASFRLQQKRIENARFSKLPALKKVPQVEKKKRTSAAHTLRALDRVLLTAMPSQKKKVIKKINCEKPPRSVPNPEKLPTLPDNSGLSSGGKSRQIEAHRVSIGGDIEGLPNSWIYSPKNKLMGGSLARRIGQKKEDLTHKNKKILAHLSNLGIALGRATFSDGIGSALETRSLRPQGGGKELRPIAEKTKGLNKTRSQRSAVSVHLGKVKSSSELTEHHCPRCSRDHSTASISSRGKMVSRKAKRVKKEEARPQTMGQNEGEVEEVREYNMGNAPLRSDSQLSFRLNNKVYTLVDPTEASKN